MRRPAPTPTTRAEVVRPRGRRAGRRPARGGALARPAWRPARHGRDRPGASRWTGSAAPIAESRFPGTVSGSTWCSSRRIAIGTWATIVRSGSASRTSRYRRNEPLQIARTTSFSETPNASRTESTSARGNEQNTNPRWAVSEPLNGPGGAWNGRTEDDRSRETANRVSPGTARTTSTTTRAARNGVVATENVTPDVRASVPCRSWPASWPASRTTSGYDTGASGSRSKITDANSAAWSPSMHAWWIFRSRATPPSRRPSRRQSSQRGRERSSGRPKISPTRRSSWRSSPGGSAVAWRRCASTSSSGVSTHCARSRRPGISTIRRRNSPSFARRSPTRRRSCSVSSAVPASASNTASTPTFMCHSGVSAATKPLSVRLRR